jgi:hypothetical protein
LKHSNTYVNNILICGSTNFLLYKLKNNTQTKNKNAKERKQRKKEN